VPPFTRTVRFRLTVWYSSLLLVFGVAFVVALNLAARLDQPDLVVLQGVRVNDIEWQPVRSGPGGAINGFTPVITPGVILKEAEDQIYSRNLDRLRAWSLLAVVGLAAASGVGGYILSGMMLRPVRDMTEVASEISETNLSRRINHQGPDDELKALADTFDSMIGRLEQSFDRQRQFVQDASHELRTPLAAIRTNIDVAEMDQDSNPDDYRALLETVKTQTERLTRLSEDLLLLSTNEPGAYETEPIDVTSLYREVTRQLNPLAAGKNVSFAIDVPDGLEVEAESDLLYRCVFNLVDNAIKYSGEGASVTLSAVQSPADVALAIRDTGPGIAPEDQERIFDRFYRLDKGRSRREGGTGLGLAIVRELVTSMHGSVGVASAPGEGSTFTLRLPVAQPGH
jgi:signal transduction histidine kinase